MDTTTRNGAVLAHRALRLQAAAELEVDTDEIEFTSIAERELWEELVAEFAERRRKDDLVWVADAA